MLGSKSNVSKQATYMGRFMQGTLQKVTRNHRTKVCLERVYILFLKLAFHISVEQVTTFMQCVTRVPFRKGKFTFGESCASKQAMHISAYNAL